MPREQSQAAIHCPNAYTRGSKPNIRYSKSIHATAHPYRQLERAPWLGHGPMCERSSRDRARLCDRCALHAAHHRTQVGADTTTAHKTGAKLKAQGAQELRSDLSLTTQQAHARTHTRRCATMSTASDSSSAAAGRPGSRVWSLRSEGRRAAPATWEGGDSR